jgi:hypothetical protein
MLKVFFSLESGTECSLRLLSSADWLLSLRYASTLSR